jgi:hypothetical protein
MRIFGEYALQLGLGILFLFQGRLAIGYQDERIMAEKQKIEQITEQQQRQQQAEAEQRWKIDLQHYLDQRDRERHHDRGR